MFGTKKPDAAGGNIPKVADLAPRIAADLQPKMLALQTEKAALLVEERELAFTESTSAADLLDNQREIRIAQIIGTIPPQPKPSRTGRLSEIFHRVRDIEDALDILRREIATETNRTAAVIRDRVAPAHKKLVTDLCDALISVHAANSAYWGLLEELENDGVSSGALGDQRASFIGAPRDKNSQLAIFLRERAKEGLFPSKSIPKDLLQ